MGSIEQIINRLKRRLGDATLQRLLEGLELAAEHGDPCHAYLRPSYLEPGYYGDALSYRWDRSYYKEYTGTGRVSLPPPLEVSGTDALQALRSRRSRRDYSSGSLSLEEVSTILYYTVGITGRAWWGGPKRVYPSAGALQPIEAYITVRNVEGLDKGLYHYHPGEHVLELLSEGDYSRRLARASLDQDHVAAAAATVILTAVYTRTASKYGHRSCRYIHLDAGFAGENVYIVVEALGLATVAVGAFYDLEICEILGVDCVTEIPMLLFPIGKRP